MNDLTDKSGKNPSSLPCSPREPHDALPQPASRRDFLKRALKATVAANAAGLALRPGRTEAHDADAHAPRFSDRRLRAYQIRQDAAQFHLRQPTPSHPDNNDEELYPNKIGSFSKGLPHNHLGEVDLAAYCALLHALKTGEPADFEKIPLGCPTPRRRLVNPQAGLAFDLEGADSHALFQRAAPALASAEEAGELVENYWMALARDVPFSDYETAAAAINAAGDLSDMSDFRGPKSGGQVTSGTLFRGLTPGDLTGPYISQFLYMPVPFGATFVEQRMRTYVSGIDFMTSYDEWLRIQRGCLPSAVEQFDSSLRYIRNGRDLSQWVHMDVLYQAYFHAMLILLSPPNGNSPVAGMGAPFDVGNPYLKSETQDGFGTFGPPHVAALMTEVAARALKAVWYQKWFVHRRLRPEAFAGRVHLQITGAAHYPITSGDLLGSPVLPLLFNQYGGYLLPMAFPEGCPLHPAYGAGHATVAGACVTILKAWFDESYLIPKPVQPTPDGLSLVPYVGPPLTVGGELNKLAANVAIGRNFAGVHWRSDAIESLKLGEAVAMNILRDQRATYNEDFEGFSLTKFDGTTVTV